MSCRWGCTPWSSWGVTDVGPDQHKECMFLNTFANVAAFDGEFLHLANLSIPVLRLWYISRLTDVRTDGRRFLSKIFKGRLKKYIEIWHRFCSGSLLMKRPLWHAQSQSRQVFTHRGAGYNCTSQVLKLQFLIYLPNKWK